MSREKMLRARELIELRRYDEAYELLEEVDHPKALEWMAKIEQLTGGRAAASRRDTYYFDDSRPMFEEEESSPYASAAPAAAAMPAAKAQRGMAGDFLFYVLVAVLGLAVVGALAFLLLPRLLIQDLSGCGAQDWWGQVYGHTTPMYNFAIDIGVVTNVEAPMRLAQLRAGRLEFERVPTPACAANARTALLTAYDQMIDAVEIFDYANPFGAFELMRASFASAGQAKAELDALSIQMRGQDARFFDMINGACPVLTWSFDYFFTDGIFYTVARDVEAALFGGYATRRLSMQAEIRAFQDAPTPQCLQAARQHMVGAAEALQRMADAVYGRDINGLLLHAETYVVEIQGVIDGFNAAGLRIDLDVSLDLD